MSPKSFLATIAVLASACGSSEPEHFEPENPNKEMCTTLNPLVRLALDWKCQNLSAMWMTDPTSAERGTYSFALPTEIEKRNTVYLTCYGNAQVNLGRGEISFFVAENSSTREVKIDAEKNPVEWGTVSEWLFRCSTPESALSSPAPRGP